MRVVAAIGRFLLIAVITWFVVVIGTTFAWDLLGIYDRDGGGTMGLAFIIGPAVAIIAGIVGSTIWGARSRRKSDDADK